MSRTDLENAIHVAVNECRAARNLPSLDFCLDLREVARYHSADMAITGYFDHHAPDGESPADRYAKFDYDCRIQTGYHKYATAGENLYALRFSGATLSVEEVADNTVDGWLDSPAHREAMLSADWNREGIGVHVLEEPRHLTVFVTQNFC